MIIFLFIFIISTIYTLIYSKLENLIPIEISIILTIFGFIYILKERIKDSKKSLK